MKKVLLSAVVLFGALFLNSCTDDAAETAQIVQTELDYAAKSIKPRRATTTGANYNEE